MRHTFDEDREFEDDMPFGEYIRKKRRIIGMNQTDFGKFLGVNQGTISQWELMARSPSIDDAMEIVKRLGGKILIVNETVGTPDMPFGYCPWQE